MQSTPSVPVEPNKMPWYTQTWFTFVMLIFVPPVGWYFLWKYRDWHLGAKVALVIASIVWVIYANVSENATQKEDKQVVAQATSNPKRTSQKPETVKTQTPVSKKNSPSKSSSETRKNIAPVNAQQHPQKEPEDKENSNVEIVNIEGLGKREVGIVNQVAYLVTDIEKTPAIGNEFSSTEASGLFYVVRLAAHNTDNATHNLDTRSIKLLDSKGREFDPSSEGGTALVLSGDKTAEIFLTQLQPGTNKTFTLVFDAPANISGLKIKIPSTGFSLEQDAVIRVP